MNFSALRFVALLAISTVDAVAIDIDTVKPLAQQEPTTISEKAAVKFKPQIRISDGCHSYAAVNAEGHASADLSLNSTGCV
ncbi:hypothetical protein ON010_g13281 [Phytophthora cinnamomi]|nr:hypothetical protein ON010_g13281 [Phytophthora cinnamomi]